MSGIGFLLPTAALSPEFDAATTLPPRKTPCFVSLGLVLPVPDLLGLPERRHLESLVIPGAQAASPLRTLGEWDAYFSLLGYQALCSPL